MRELFTITITTSKDFGESPDFFTDEGKYIGRVLCSRKNNIDSKYIFYS